MVAGVLEPAEAMHDPAMRNLSDDLHRQDGGQE
jgi:hypothetical protein